MRSNLLFQVFQPCAQPSTVSKSNDFTHFPIGLVSAYSTLPSAAVVLGIEPLTGFRRVWVRERRTKADFAYVLRDLVDEVYPDAELIVLVVDNLNIHHPACLYEAFPPAEVRRIAEKLEWHYTPEHASWLNIPECELSVLRRQCLNRRIPDIGTVQAEVAAWEQARNSARVHIDWRFTTADARIKLKRLYPVVNVHKST